MEYTFNIPYFPHSFSSSLCTFFFNCNSLLRIRVYSRCKYVIASGKYLFICSQGTHIVTYRVSVLFKLSVYLSSQLSVFQCLTFFVCLYGRMDRWMLEWSLCVCKFSTYIFLSMIQISGVFAFRVKCQLLFFK